MPFSLSAFANRPLADPGDEVRIDFFVAGDGALREHRLLVNLPSEMVSDRVKVRSIKFATGASLPYPLPVDPPQEDDVDSRFTARFAPQLFTRNSLGQLYSESTVTCESGVYPPLSVVFTVADSAPAGEHRIVATFVYSEGTDLGIAEGIATVRVRSFGERNQSFFGGALTLLVFVAPLLTAIVPAGFGRALVVSTAGALSVLMLMLLLRR